MFFYWSRKVMEMFLSRLDKRLEVYVTDKTCLKLCLLVTGETRIVENPNPGFTSEGGFQGISDFARMVKAGSGCT